MSAEVVQLVEQAGPYLTTALPAAGETVHVTASGEPSIAAKTIGAAVTGDHATIRP